MSNVVESENFSDEANELLSEVFKQCDGQSVEMVVNVLLNGAIIAVIQTGGDIERLRSMMMDMVDAHIAAQRQQDPEKKKD